MARYIDAERLCRGLKDMASVQYPDKQKAILGVVSTIENTPAADVVEVKHGEWIGRCGTGQYDDYYCSLCGMYEEGTRNRKFLGKYCPNCGAKMDVKEGK
jgi:hypothetical protein